MHAQSIHPRPSGVDISTNTSCASTCRTGHEMEEEAGSSFKLFGTVIQKADGQGKEEVEEPGRMAAEEARAAAAAALPCPRCESSNTKFCYFNNYNVNQPRHFCRACHRYWTAGGTLRNVLVGAGRRRGRPGIRGRAAAAGGGRDVLDHTSPAGSAGEG